MRMLVATVLLLTLSAVAGGQGGDKVKPVARFGIVLDIKKFPQKTPKEALGSVLKAIGERQFDYLLAYLADPTFVDQRISMLAAQLGPDVNENQKQAAAFGRLVQTVTDGFREDPSKVRDLQLFFGEGEWTESSSSAEAVVKSLPARRVFMKLAAPDRWVMMDKEK
jgi:hypothetical protein